MSIEVTEAVHLTMSEATIAKLDLKPDDVIVLRVTDPAWRVTAAQAAEMRERVRSAVGDHEVLILAAGLDLEIVAPSEVPE